MMSYVHLIYQGRAVCGSGATSGVGPAALHRVTCGRCRDLLRESLKEGQRQLGPDRNEPSRVEYYDFASGRDVFWVRGAGYWVDCIFSDAGWRAVEHDEWGAFRRVIYHEKKAQSAGKES